MTALHDMVRHLDLKTIATRIDIDLAKDEPSARGLFFVHTEPGMMSCAVITAALGIKHLIEEEAPAPWRLPDIEAHMGDQFTRDRLPAALKRLAKMKQLRLDFDREGALVTIGPAWIET
jgi:hypothetical protein